MLKQRILTAIVLLAILLPALFYPSHVPFACVMLALIGAAAWEWGRLNGYGPRMSLFLGAEMVLLCALSWWLGLLERPLLGVWIVASAAWVLGGAALLRVAVPGWPRVPKVSRRVCRNATTRAGVISAIRNWPSSFFQISSCRC